MFAASKGTNFIRNRVAVRAVASQQNSANTSVLIIPRPVGATAGDTLVVFAGSNTTSNNWVASSVNWVEIVDGDNSAPAMLAAYRVLSAGDAAITDFTFSSNAVSNARHGGSIIAVQDGTYYANSGLNSIDASNTTCTALTVQSNYNQTLMLSCFITSLASAGAAFSTPTNMSAVASNSDVDAPTWGVFSQYVGAANTGVRLSVAAGVPAAGQSEAITLLFKPN